MFGLQAVLRLVAVVGILWLAIPFDGAQAAGSGLLATVEAEDVPFQEIVISDQLIVYLHQRTLGEAVVEKDYIVYQFSRMSEELLDRKSHWRNDVPDRLPPLALSAEDAAVLVGDPGASARLLLIAPDSDVFPLDPAPLNPCWVVRSDTGGQVALTVVDAVTGEILGPGIPPPASGFSLTGPIDFNPCENSWHWWADNAHGWFETMGFPTDVIIWPTEEEVQSHVQSDDIAIFYELAHGGSDLFNSGCIDGQDPETTFAVEIELWLTGYYKKLFAFIGSCDGLCGTGVGTFSDAFRKGSNENATTVGYCGMSTPQCDDCWSYSLNWQDALFNYMSVGYPVKEAFDMALADYPVCAINACMRFAGDEAFSLVFTVGACCIGEACQILAPDDCTALGGEWFPGIESCDPLPCVAHPCCTGSVCQMLNPFDCMRAGGEIFDTIASCDPNPCDWGACCLGDDCVHTILPVCNDSGGAWHDGIDCEPDPCTPYACCIGDECQVLAYVDCVAAGGQLMEEYASCDPNPCAARACCIGDVCYLRTLPACTAAGGIFLPGVEVCDEYICMPDSMNLFGGVLIAHAPAGLTYTDGVDWCARYEDEFRIEASSQQVTRIDPAGPEETATWYVIAAWGEPRSWNRVTFGLGDYDPGQLGIGAWGPCNGGGVQSASPGWPGPNEGVTMMHADRWSGDFEAVYWFASYAYTTGTLALCAWEQAGETGFGNPDGVTFPVSCYGALGIYTDGVACHPQENAACCLGAECQLVSHQECVAMGGVWQSGVASCDPNPCTPRACCVGEACTLASEAECGLLGGIWYETIDACDPDPCSAYACCIGETCQLLSEPECAGLGGDWIYGHAACDPNPCGAGLALVRADGAGMWPTIQTALDAAAAGDTVYLADGVYRGAGNRDLDCLGTALCLRSLRGDAAACIIACEGSAGDEHRGFHFDSGEPAGCRIEGITIRDGYAANGGAILCTGSAPSISGCIFSGNESPGVGGAVLAIAEAAPAFEQCTFVGNAAALGGAVGGDSAAIVLEACTFHCSAADSGACIYGDEAQLDVLRCILGFSVDGEAVHLTAGSGADFSCCDIYGNAEGDWTGVIAEQLGRDGNFSMDPYFCDAEGGDLGLWNYTPCDQQGCGLIGAWPVACWAPQELADGQSGRPGEAVMRLQIVSSTPTSLPGTVRIAYAIPEGGANTRATLKVYDAGGRLVRRLLDEVRPAGAQTLTWDGRDEEGRALGSGIFFLRLETAGERLTRPVVVVR
ncbi:MAG: hypothetical protein KAY32_08175 [Candidatus Eisenbacteria sp.]|nr:hypothetical protein [Candidatus Eisenbacteria bacterium]